MYLNFYYEVSIKQACRTDVPLCAPASSPVVVELFCSPLFLFNGPVAIHVIHPAEHET